MRHPLSTNHDHIVGSGVELIKVTYLFEVDHCPGNVFHWITCSSFFLPWVKDRILPVDDLFRLFSMYVELCF